MFTDRLGSRLNKNWKPLKFAKKLGVPTVEGFVLDCKFPRRSVSTSGKFSSRQTRLPNVHTLNTSESNGSVIQGVGGGVVGRVRGAGNSGVGCSFRGMSAPSVGDVWKKGRLEQQIAASQPASTTQGKCSLRRNKARITTGSFPGSKARLGTYVSRNRSIAMRLTGGSIPVDLEKLSW